MLKKAIVATIQGEMEETVVEIGDSRRLDRQLQLRSRRTWLDDIRVNSAEDSSVWTYTFTYARPRWLPYSL